MSLRASISKKQDILKNKFNNLMSKGKKGTISDNFELKGPKSFNQVGIHRFLNEVNRVEQSVRGIIDSIPPDDQEGAPQLNTQIERALTSTQLIEDLKMF